MTTARLYGEIIIDNIVPNLILINGTDNYIYLLEAENEANYLTNYKYRFDEDVNLKCEENNEIKDVVLTGNISYDIHKRGTNTTLKIYKTEPLTNNDLTLNYESSTCIIKVKTETEGFLSINYNSIITPSTCEIIINSNCYINGNIKLTDSKLIIYGDVMVNVDYVLDTSGMEQETIEGVNSYVIREDLYYGKYKNFFPVKKKNGCQVKNLSNEK